MGIGLTLVSPGRCVARSYLVAIFFLLSLSLSNLKADELRSPSEPSSLGDKTLQFLSLEALDEAELIKLLPLERSSAWWQLNTREIERTLQAHPLVKSASVSGCESRLQMDCFLIEISERKLLAKTKLTKQEGQLDHSKGEDLGRLALRWWLVGEDGHLLQVQSSPSSRNLVPVDNQQMSLPGVHLDQLTEIEGIYNQKASSQLIRRRAAYVAEALMRIKELGYKPVIWGELSENGELSVRFQGEEYTVVIGADVDSPKIIAQRLQRLDRLLIELRNELPRVQKIDLALGQFGVVTFRD